MSGQIKSEWRRDNIMRFSISTIGEAKLTLNKPWGVGIKTGPIQRLPLARQTKFELKPPYEFFYFYLDYLTTFSFGDCI